MKRATPTTHISKIASDFMIMEVDPYDLKESFDLSTDYGEDKDPHDSGFITLLQKKYGNCSDWFLENLASEGIIEPLVMIIRDDGLWQFDDGHHRLMWALLNNVPVPVVFAEMQPGQNHEEDDTFYRVARRDVEHRHYTTEADVLINETEDYLSNVAEAATDEFVVIPVQRGRHRAEGKHRAA